MNRFMDLYDKCTICPRNCRAERINGKTGFCRATSDMRIARAALHMWEEPCISGTKGSGTVFFSGCNMGCVFCQNKEISRGLVGKYISEERLVEIFFMLKEQGANNINLVTGDIFVPTIRRCIEKAKDQGFDLPFLLNTSSYIEEDTVKSLEGFIDIYLPDMKYIRDDEAIRYSNAPGYVEIAKKAIAEMVRQQPVPVFFDNSSIMKKGVVVRHLLMPGMLIQAKLIVNYLYQTYGDKIYISLMNQYTPDESVLKDKYPEINRKVTEYEYKSLTDHAANIGVTNGYIQVGETAEESFIPAFDLTGV